MTKSDREIVEIFEAYDDPVAHSGCVLTEA